MLQRTPSSWPAWAYAIHPNGREFHVLGREKSPSWLSGAEGEPLFGSVHAQTFGDALMAVTGILLEREERGAA